MKKINNVEDVTKKAEVSITIVSRVINETKFVEKETKMKVSKAIKKLNYAISLSANSLRGKEQD